MTSSLDGLTVVGVIVTYGQRYELCRIAVEGALRSGVDRVVVVCNGTPNTSTLLRETRWPPGTLIELVDLPENSGSAGGFRRGIEAALLGTSDALWLLDDDSDIDSKALVALRTAVAQSTGRYFAFASLRASIVNQVKVVNGTRSAPDVGSFMHFDIGRYFHSKPPAEQGRYIEVPNAPYGGLLISRSLVERIGLPMEELYLYEDDTEYTARIPATGAQILLCRDSVIRDADAKWINSAVSTSGPEAASTSGPERLLRADDETRLYYAVRNRSWLDIQRNRRHPTVRFCLSFIVFNVYLTLQAVRTRRWRNYRLYLRALRDGVAGRLGVMSTQALKSARESSAEQPDSEGGNRGA